MHFRNTTNAVKAIILGTSLILASVFVNAQSTGDFRSTASGNWGSTSTWETWNGATWVAAGSTPTSGTSVYIESSHEVTLTAAGSCLDLHLNNTSSARLTTGAFNLEISGKIRAYSGTAPGTDGNPSSSTSWINTSGGGSIRFVGTGRDLTESGQWNSNPSGWRVEFALNANETGFLRTHFMAGDITISSGIVYVTGGLWMLPSNGSSGTGTLTVDASGTLTVTNGKIQRTFATSSSSTSHFGTFTLNGTLNLFAADPYIGATTVTLNGTVVYNRVGAQNFLSRGPSTSGATIDTYNNVTVSINSTKTMVRDITVNGTMTLTGTAVLANGGFTLTYGGSSTLAYVDCGTRSTTDAEFPSSSGPNGLTINNSGSVMTLHSSRTINGTLTMTAGNLTTSSTETLTIGSSGSTSGGSSDSFVNGPLAATFESTSFSFTFPVGKSSAYRPVIANFNHSATTATTYTVEVIASAPTSRTLPVGLTNVSGIRYYEITKGSGASLSAGSSVTLAYDGDDGVTDETQLRVAKDDGGSNWTNLGGVGSAITTGTISTTVAFTTGGDFVLANVGNAATSGDYRSITSGNWGSSSTWETYNGSAWVSATTFPTASNDVYIEAGHTVTLNSSFSCGDLNLENGSGTRISTGIYSLSINGKIRAYTGAAPGTSDLPPTSSTWISTGTGELRFVGSTRDVTESGEWGGGPSGFRVQFALNFGNTATLNTHFRAGTLWISTGILRVPNFFAIRVDEGTAGTGTIEVGPSGTLSTHSTTISQNGSKADGTHIGTFTVDGLWIITGPNTRLGASTINFNGSVRYTNQTGFTNLVNQGNMTTGTAEPFTYTNLSIQGNGRKFLMGNTSVSGTLELVNDGDGNVLVVPEYNLTLGASASVTGSFSEFNMIITTSTGQVRKTYSASGSFTFPVGDYTGAADYSPITLNFVSGSFGGYAGVRVFNVKEPNHNDNTDYLERYWELTTTITSFSLTVTATYEQSDVNGSEANLVSAQYVSSYSYYTDADDASNGLTLTGLSSVGNVTAKANTGSFIGTLSEQEENQIDEQRGLFSNNAANIIEQQKLEDNNGTTVGSINTSNELQAFPNPFTNNVTVVMPNGTEATDIQLIDLSGKQQNVRVQGRGNSLSTFVIDTYQLPQGVYLLQVFDGTQWSTKKLVK